MKNTKQVHAHGAFLCDDTFQQFHRKRTKSPQLTIALYYLIGRGGGGGMASGQWVYTLLFTSKYLCLLVPTEVSHEGGCYPYQKM